MAKRIVNFLCDEALLKSFDEALPEGMNRTDALVLLLEAVAKGKIKLSVDVRVEWNEQS